MSKSFKENIIGQRFHRLVVVDFIPNNAKKSYWLCRCDCGTEVIVQKSNLKNGNTRSCGCLKSDVHYKHGERHSRLYNIWALMKERCSPKNSSNPAYKNYAGRGIEVCSEWKNDFISFRDWSLANGYKDALTIDRIDNDKGYSPTNCRWVDMKTQSRNKRRTIIIEYQGVKMPLADAAEASGIKNDILYHRYTHGDRGERLFRKKLNSMDEKQM